MKKVSILLLILTLISSCSSDDGIAESDLSSEQKIEDVNSEQNNLTEENLQEIGIPEEEMSESMQSINARSLVSTVSGSNFRRFFLDVNSDHFTDLVAIKTRNTGTGRTEIHILDGKSGFTKFLVQTGTALPQVGSNFDILVGKSHRGGVMIYAIKKRNTGSGKTEIHVISSNRGYNRFYSQNATPLPQTNNSYSFRLVGGLHQYLHHIQVYRNGAKAGLLNAHTTYRSYF